jgi:hypothetical protein
MHTWLHTTMLQLLQHSLAVVGLSHCAQDSRLNRHGQSALTLRYHIHICLDQLS